MSKTIIFVNKKKTGRPPTGVGTLVGQRWTADQLRAVDDWRRAQADVPGRGEAIRRLVEIGLAADKPHRSPAKTRSRAAELAGAAIDKASDPTASGDERATRKRRLVDGPNMVRGARKDRS